MLEGDAMTVSVNATDDLASVDATATAAPVNAVDQQAAAAPQATTTASTSLGNEKKDPLMSKSTAEQLNSCLLYTSPSPRD